MLRKVGAECLTCPLVQTTAFQLIFVTKNTNVSLDIYPIDLNNQAGA